jgi:hypothetical protein
VEHPVLRFTQDGEQGRTTKGGESPLHFSILSGITPSGGILKDVEDIKTRQNIEKSIWKKFG